MVSFVFYYNFAVFDVVFFNGNDIIIETKIFGGFL